MAMSSMSPHLQRFSKANEDLGWDFPGFSSLQQADLNFRGNLLRNTFAAFLVPRKVGSQSESMLNPRLETRKVLAISKMSRVFKPLKKSLENKRNNPNNGNTCLKKKGENNNIPPTSLPKSFLPHLHSIIFCAATITVLQATRSSWSPRPPDVSRSNAICQAKDSQHADLKEPLETRWKGPGSGFRSEDAGDKDELAAKELKKDTIILEWHPWWSACLSLDACRERNASGMKTTNN